MLCNNMTKLSGRKAAKGRCSIGQGLIFKAIVEFVVGNHVAVSSTPSFFQGSKVETKMGSRETNQ